MLTQQYITLKPLEFDIFAGMDVDKKSISVTFISHNAILRWMKIPYDSGNLIRYVRNTGTFKYTHHCIRACKNESCRQPEIGNLTSRRRVERNSRSLRDLCECQVESPIRASRTQKQAAWLSETRLRSGVTACSVMLNAG